MGSPPLRLATGRVAALALAGAVALSVALYMCARRASMGDAEFVVAASALAAALWLARAPPAGGGGGGRLLERFETVAEALNAALAPQMDRLLRAYEGTGAEGAQPEGGQKGEGEDGGEDADEVDDPDPDVPIDADRYPGEEPGRLRAVQLAYKRIQLMTCRLKGYDAAAYDALMAALRRAAHGLPAPPATAK